MPVRIGAVSPMDNAMEAIEEAFGARGYGHPLPDIP